MSSAWLSMVRLVQRWLRLHGVGRHPWQRQVAARGRGAAAPGRDEQRLRELASLPLDAVFAQLRARPEGLDARDVAIRLRRFGQNALPREPAWQRWWQLLRSAASPFNLLLAALAVLAWIADDARAATVIGVMVVLSTALRIAQEGRAHQALDRLQRLVRSTATVVRSAGIREESSADRAVEVPLSSIVPGDIVLLAAGDLVPADCRLIESRELFVSQAGLTGESLPVEKDAGRATAPGESLFAEPTLAFMGTTVVSGGARALVVATGPRTVFGELALSAGIQDAGLASLQQQMNRIGLMLIGVAAVMLPLVFLINGLLRGDWSGAFLFALSVAVGLTPEMLPMVVTTALAKGAVELAQRQIVVKNLDAIQALGAMDVLCIDKTGTLTEDRIVLDRHLDPDGNDSVEVYRLAWLNSRHQTGLRSALDRAILSHPDAAQCAREEALSRAVDEIPFDFERRRLSVVLARADGVQRLICKGALREVLSCCDRVRSAAGERYFDDGLREAAMARVKKLEYEGLRVVAIATRDFEATRTRFGRVDESDLLLAGFVAFLDPPRESAGPALSALAAHGVRTMVLTGDTETVAGSVCARVGLATTPMLTGPEIEALDDAALARAFESVRVAARLSPHQKERIVKVLRRSGQSVGFLGDGINDAPALRAADVGISVDSAVDVAREAADVVLLQKSLLVIDAGVMQGRAALCNMNRYLRMAASSNFGNVLSVLVASAFLPFLPMLPLQLLVQNLLYDLSQAALPFDHVEPELIAEPLRWEPGEVTRFMLIAGPVSSVFDLLAFAVLTGVLGVGTVALQSQFQSGWLMLGLATQVLVVQLMRAPSLPFTRQRAAWPVTAASLAILAIGVWLPYGPLAPVFKLAPPPQAWFGWMVVLLAGYLLAALPVRRRLARNPRSG